ncbi:hypothetical protein CHUAL_000020 [Chamberlinius hualienensis]
MPYAVLPTLPFEKKLKADVQPGFQLLVSGHVHYAGEATPLRGFSINLIGENGEDGDFILHFNPRFHEEYVALNNRVAGSWGTEERPSHYPFKNNHDFIVVIQAHHENFKIYVNGDHLVDYKYHSPLTAIKAVYLIGQPAEVTFHQLAVTEHNTDAYPSAPVASNLSRAVHAELPHVTKRPEELPVEISIPGNLQVGSVLAVKGKPLENAERFSVNWYTSDGNVAFHFNPRFDGDDMVVRNTRIDNSWGEEERDGRTPFKQGEKFKIFVRVHPTHYEVSVNGRHFCNYKHRLENIGDINKIRIKGDVKVKLVTVASIKSNDGTVLGFLVCPEETSPSPLSVSPIHALEVASVGMEFPPAGRNFRRKVTGGQEGESSVNGGQSGAEKTK